MIVSKGGVAQSKSKGKQRSPVIVDILMGPRRVEVIKVRQLSYTAGKRDREPASRIVVAKNSFGDCSASELSWIPCFENGWDVLLCPADRQRPAIFQHQNNRFSGGNDSLQQLLLISGQIKVRTIESLARD